MNSAQNIQVAVRCRPLNERENKLNSHSIIECNERSKEITACDKNSQHISLDKKFTFDKVFGVTSKQSDVYNQVVKPVVLEVIEGYNCTIFAYGQTGTGKTHTMEGEWAVDDMSQSWETDPMVGVIPRSVAHLFTALNSIQNCDYSVKISFMELYNEELSDLLSESSATDEKRRIYDDPARKGSVQIPGLEEAVVKNKNEVYRILQKGSQRRQQAATLMNAKSSRSHSIFSITVFIKEKSIEGEETVKVGKLNLVDLAGSENIERSGAKGKRAAEAGKINKSLTTLGRVITALVEHRDHIPYRESNLTRLLQDSLGGRTKTTLIATISPALCNLEETLSTLDYAHKAKSIRNKPEVNQKLVKKALIKEYSDEIEKLKRELLSTRDKNGIFLPPEIYDEMESKISNQKEEIREHLTKIESLSDDMEKVEENLAVTKDSLMERNVQLRQTTETLNQTESSLTKKRKECDETAHLLEEQVKTEAKLYGEATTLRQTTIEQNNDITRLREKVDRCSSVAINNMHLTDQFSKHMHEKILEFAKYDLQASSEQGTSLCNVCDALQEVNSRMEDMKTENVCQLNIYEQKQQNWLNLRKQFLTSEIQHGFEAFYKQFLEYNEQSGIKSAENIVQQLELCSSHSSMFTQTYTNLTRAIEQTTVQNGSFLVSFIQNSEAFLTSTDTSIKNSSGDVTMRLETLEKSVTATSNDLGDLKTMTNEFRSEIDTVLSQLTKKIGEKSCQLNKVLEKVIQNNENQANELQEIKRLAEVNSSDCLAAKNAKYTELVSEPVVQLLEANKQSLRDLSALTKTLCSNYNDSAVHFKTSLDVNKETDSTKAAKLTELTINHSEKLTKQCESLSDELARYASDSERFFQNFNANSIEAELADLIELTGHAQHEVNVTTASVDDRKGSAQEYAAELGGAVETFAVKEYEVVLPSGQTPSKKDFVVGDEPQRTKDHVQLIESYRQRLGELEAMQPPQEVVVQSIEMITPKIESGYPMKRVASEKENALNEKQASKVSKNSYGSLRGLSAKPRRAFGAAN